MAVNGKFMVATGTSMVPWAVSPFTVPAKFKAIDWPLKFRFSVKDRSLPVTQPSVTSIAPKSVVVPGHEACHQPGRT